MVEIKKMAIQIVNRIKGALATVMPGPLGDRSPLMTGRSYYKPFSYPQFYDRWDAHERMHWLPSEVPMHEDVKDWQDKLDDNERAFLTNLFRFFTQGDIDVAGGYYSDMIPAFCKTPEVAMFLGSIAAREGVHIAAYSHLIESLSMPETTYIEFLQYNEMREKQAYVKKFQNAFTARHDVLIASLFVLLAAAFLFNTLGVVATAVLLPLLIINVSNHVSTRHLEHVAAAIALFSGFTEGMQLFSSFAMLLAFPKTGVMRGMGDIVQWSVTDETMHTRGMIQLFKIFLSENRELEEDPVNAKLGKRWADLILGPRGIRVKRLEATVHTIAREMVALEDGFIDLTFDSYTRDAKHFKGLARSDLKEFIRFIADVRLEDMGFAKIYNIRDNPLPDFETMLNAPVVTNFFEQRSSDYARNAHYDWGTVWGNRALLETQLFGGDLDEAVRSRLTKLAATQV